MAATVSPIANLQLLNRHNYEDWSFQVKVYLLAEDVWDVVEAATDPPKPEDGEAEFRAWRKNNAKALLAIRARCGDDTYPIIKDITTAKVAWDMLAEELKPSDSDSEELNPSDSEEGLHNNNNEESDVDVKYAPLYDSLECGDWNGAKEFIDRHPEALTHKGSSKGGTALHEAIERKQLHIVEELLKLMTEQDLEIEDYLGSTAFSYALLKGMAAIVASMVEKNNKLVTMRFTNEQGMTPVAFACNWGHWEIARFLYSRTPIQVLTEENNGRDGAELISQCLLNINKFDIGWDLLQKCPELALTETFSPRVSPLNTLAGLRSAFPSEVPLKFWQRWIYNNIHVQQPQHAPINSDVCVNLEELEDDKRNRRDLISSVTGFFQGVVKNLLKLLGIHDLHEMRLHHVRILEFLRLMGKVVKSKKIYLRQMDFVRNAVFRAVELGHVEFIEEMCKAIPLTMRDKRGISIFHYAVECRQEKVLNLIYGLNEYDRTIILASADNFNNTILHVAGSLSTHLNHIQGAALQMQRELQWFKEVESIVPPSTLEVINFTEKMIAREVFTKNHKELMKEGEESMKGTATSCTVVGALIVTIMFAAAFTVPGGSNQDTGFPIFLRNKFFRVFLISDSISLFSSTTSVMIFLGILTSRYAEDDFLRSLPTKMLLGLFTLFLSIAAMMVAFSSTLFIMLEGESWVSIPIILLAGVPIASFVWMQFPLFLDIFMFTYGRGIFDKKCRAWEKNHDYAV
ncbi:hypothetical protein ACE6H2_011945 [Prunus campanulata]